MKMNVRKFYAIVIVVCSVCHILGLISMFWDIDVLVFKLLYTILIPLLFIAIIVEKERGKNA